MTKKTIWLNKATQDQLYGIIKNCEASRPKETSSGVYQGYETILKGNEIIFKWMHSATRNQKYYEFARLKCLQAGDRLKVIVDYFTDESIWGNYFNQIFDAIAEAWPENTGPIEPEQQAAAQDIKSTTKQGSQLSEIAMPWKQIIPNKNYNWPVLELFYSGMAEIQIAKRLNYSRVTVLLSELRRDFGVQNVPLAKDIQKRLISQKVVTLRNLA